MIKRLLSLALSLCLVLGSSAAVIASESETIDVIVNDAVIDLGTTVQVVDQVTYVPYWPVVRALYPEAKTVWQNDQAVVTAPGLTLTIKPGRCYLVANGRYLYMPNGGAIGRSDNILVPSRILGAALGANVSWDPVGGNVVFTAGSGPIASGDTVYDADDLYVLSHIIFAESGNQPLEGKIAVGNVVLNRVASSSFPNTIRDVVYQRGQFSPVSNGTINLTPSEESVIAAKLCLDGANTVGNALYFVNPKYSGKWFKTRTLVAVIKDHAFYV